MGLRGPIPKDPAKRQNRNRHALIVVPPADGPVSAAPAAPAGLLASSLARWDEFWASDVARAVDRHAHLGPLRDWIEAVDERERVFAVLRKSRVVKGSQGQPVINPLAAYMQSREAVIARAEAAYGMTPGAMARLGLTVGQAKLTAAQLNAMLERSPSDSSDQPEFRDWEAG